MSAAASASTTKARARARPARSTTVSSSTPRRSCSRWPRPVAEHGFTAAARDHRNRPRDDRASRRAGRQCQRSRACAGRRVPPTRRRRAGSCCAACAKSTAKSMRVSLIELYHEAQHHWSEGHALFALGQLALRRARAAGRSVLRDRQRACAPRLKPDERSHRQALDELNEKLVDKYFVNFSMFESMPGRLGDRSDFSDRADRRPRPRAGSARRDRRSHLRFRRPHRPLCRCRRRRCQPAAARAERRANRIGSASSWSARIRKRSATSTTCSATPTR